MTDESTPPTNAQLRAIGSNPADAPGFRVADAWRLIVKHALVVLLFAVVAPVAAAFVSGRLPKVYEASTTVNFDFNVPRTLGQKVDVFDPYSDYMNKQELMETEFRVLTSMKVARQVVIDAGLDSDRVFLAQTFGGAAPGSVKAETIASVIASRVKVEQVRGTHLATVKYTDSDPVRAQRLVATIVDTYMRLAEEESAGTSTSALEWLQTQLEKLKGDLHTSETRLHDFKQERNLLSVSMNDQANMLREEITALNNEVTATKSKHDHLVNRASSLAKVTKATPDELPQSELLSDTVLSELRQKYLLARTELETLTAQGKGENHPDVRVARAKLDTALDAFVHQVRNIQTSALRDAQLAANDLGALRGRLETAKQHALDLNLQEISYNQLQRQAVSDEKVYQSVLERVKEVDLSRVMSTKTVKVLDPPLLPGAPIRPNTPVNIGIGLAVGLLLGIGIAFLRELLDRTVKSPADVEQKIGLTHLGLLPLSEIHGADAPNVRRRRGGRVAPETAPELAVAAAPTSSMAEAARSIRSNIMFMSPDRPPKILLVTSASPTEGKTTTATSLAITFAQAGARTLLLDLDLRRPRLHRIFGTGSDRGISLALVGEPLEDAISETTVPNLSVLPAGPVPPNPAELLMSDKLADMIQRLGGMFDRVIIDSPPLNPVTDSVILSTRVDGVVLVIRAFESTVDQVRHAARSMLSVNAPILGAVLNAVDLGKLEYKYAYYYRYYRETPGGEKSEEAVA